VTTDGAIASAAAHVAADARTRVYGLLAKAFRSELTPKEIEIWRSNGMLAVLASAGVNLDEAFLNTPAEALSEELATEYAMLFIGPGQHLAPYESIQREGASGQLRGPETDAVRAFIEGSGYGYLPQFLGMPDHICVELEYLGHLVKVEAEAWSSGNEAAAMHSRSFQASFIERHLGRWVVPFCSKIVRRTGSTFYREIALLTTDFISSEQALLNSGQI